MPDLLWPVLLLAGLEAVEIAPGDTYVTPLAFVSFPYSSGRHRRSHGIRAARVYRELRTESGGLRYLLFTLRGKGGHAICMECIFRVHPLRSGNRPRSSAHEHRRYREVTSWQILRRSPRRSAGD